MNHSVRWLLCYLFSVLGFSLLYWGAWLHKPDRFIINPQLNMHPFHNIDKFLWEDRPQYKTGFHVDLSRYKNEYDTFYLKITEAEISIAETESELKSLDYDLIELDKKRNSEIDINFREFERKKLKPFRNKEIRLQAELEILEQKFPQEVKTDADLRIIEKIGNKRVELAQAKVKTATQAAKNAESLEKNVAGFMSDETWSGYQKVFETRKKLFQARYEYELLIGNTRQKAIDTLRRDIKIIRERVGWPDFIFFSVGISTTTTFGDLVANDTTTKLLISIQLLICIIIVAKFLNSVIKKN